MMENTALRHISVGTIPYISRRVRTLLDRELDSRQGHGLFSPHCRVHAGSGAHTAFCQMDTGGGGLSQRVKRPGRMLTTHLHLVPRLRMRGSIPPLPIRFHCVVLKGAEDSSSWRGT
jgi:hypothetical protein